MSDNKSLQPKVLIIESVERFSYRLQSFLKEEGFLYDIINESENKFHDLKCEKYDFVILCQQKITQENQTLYGIQHLTPHLPVMTFYFESSNCIPDFNMNSQYVFYNYLAPKLEICKSFHKLVNLSRILKENAALKSSIEFLRTVHLKTSGKDLNDFFKISLKLIGEELNASEGYWVYHDHLDFFINQMWKVSSLNKKEVGLGRQPQFYATDNKSPKNLSTHLLWLNKTCDSDWRSIKSLTLVGEDKDKKILLMPLLDTKQSRIIGYYIFVNPEKEMSFFVTEKLRHIRSTLTQSFTSAVAMQEVKKLNYIDDVTELYNQRYLHIVLDKEIKRAQRSSEVFSVMFIDVDHFKKVNDTEGHLVGSQVLIELGKVLGGMCRSTDYGFRYGGDEFLLILLNTPSDKAHDVGERIRKKVENTTFDVKGVKVQVTLSIGIASFPEHAKTKEEIIRLADEAMYCGKNKSRNIVLVAS